MAKQLSYEDPDNGAVFPESVWLPVGIYIDVSGPNVKIDFLGYKNKDVAAAIIKSSLGVPDAAANRKGTIGTKSYSLTQAEYAALAMAAPVGSTVLDVISNVCYTAIANSTQHLIDDPDDPEKQIGFFAKAKDVNIFA